jgi:hypothetical protein
MFERNLIILLCVCIAVLGTLGLVAWIGREVPVEATPGQVPNLDVGTLVIVEGYVAAPGPSGSGGVTIFHLDDGMGATVRVFVTSRITVLSVGDWVRVRGRVALYEGRVEVHVEGEDDLSVLVRSRSPWAELHVLVMEPWRFDGTEPRVHAVVAVAPMADLGGSTWWCLLSDPGDPDGPGVLARIDPNAPFVHWEVGAEVDLRVALRYDASRGFVYLEVLGQV